MAVDEVVVEPFGGPELFEPTGEFPQVGVERQGRHGTMGADRQLNQPHIPTQLEPTRTSGVLQTGEDIDPVSLLPQDPGQFPDVDAHAPGIPLPQLPDGA